LGTDPIGLRWPQIKSYALYQLDINRYCSPEVTVVRCRHSDTRHIHSSIQFGRPSLPMD